MWLDWQKDCFLHHTTAYHSQSNDLVERFHCHLKAALRAHLSGPSWTKDLPWVLQGIRTAPKKDLGCFSAELVYGQPLLTVPGILLSAATVLQVGIQSSSAGMSKQVHLHQSPPPSTGPDVQPSHHTSAKPSLLSSDEMATELLFNGPMRAPLE